MTVRPRHAGRPGITVDGIISDVSPDHCETFHSPPSKPYISILQLISKSEPLSSTTLACWLRQRADKGRREKERAIALKFLKILIHVCGLQRAWIRAQRDLQLSV